MAKTESTDATAPFYRCYTGSGSLSNTNLNRMSPNSATSVIQRSPLCPENNEEMVQFILFYSNNKCEVHIVNYTPSSYHSQHDGRHCSGWTRENFRYKYIQYDLDLRRLYISLPKIKVNQDLKLLIQTSPRWVLMWVESLCQCGGRDLNTSASEHLKCETTGCTYRKADKRDTCGSIFCVPLKPSQNPTDFIPFCAQCQIRPNA